jgi:hypothetical protein
VRGAATRNQPIGEVRKISVRNTIACKGYKTNCGRKKPSAQQGESKNQLKGVKSVGAKFIEAKTGSTPNL